MPVRLELGRPITTGIRSGEVHRYQITARTGEFLKGNVLQDGIGVNVKGFFHDDSKIRTFSVPPVGAKVFRFVAEAAGIYQLELTAVDRGQSEGRYTIALDQLQPMAERIGIPIPEQYSSPRIRVLRKKT